MLATVESGCDRVGMLETVEGERKVIQGRVERDVGGRMPGVELKCSS